MTAVAADPGLGADLSLWLVRPFLGILLTTLVLVNAH
jgi:hypothetical protein